MPDGFYILRNPSRSSYPALDDHGQPKNRRWNAKRLDERSVDEFLGLCRGLVADGLLTDFPRVCQQPCDYIAAHKSGPNHSLSRSLILLHRENGERLQAGL